MQLIVLLSFFVFTGLLNRISVFDRLQFFEKKMHSECLLLLPQYAKSISELKALVCGENFEQLHTTQYYVSTGLIHLFVVSGSHLIVIKVLLDFFCVRLLFFISERRRRSLILMILFFYTAVCEFNPPVVRAFLVVAFTSGFVFERLFWPSHFKTFCVGLFCLSLEPKWALSLSLQLSWLIAIGINLNEITLQKKHALLKQVCLSIWIYPTLLFFQTPNPFFILTNFCMAWFLELILFPLSLLVCLFHFLSPFFDKVIELLNFMLLKTEISLLPSSLEKSSGLIFGNWALILILHFVCHTLFVLKQRSHATEN